MENEIFLEIIESSILPSELNEIYDIVDYVCMHYSSFELIGKLIKSKLEFNSNKRYKLTITVKNCEFTNISAITAVHFKYGRIHIFIKEISN
jgi:hypothetical protein